MTTAVGLPERLRSSSAPLVALLACSLGLSCSVSLAHALRDLDALVEVDDRFVGWVGAASMLSLLVAAVVMFSSGRVGSGPALTLSVAAALFGLTLADDVVSGAQLTLSLLLLGIGSGGLVAASLGMAMELPRGWARLTLMAWSLPLAVAWPVLAWLSAGGRGGTDDAALAVHPAGWLVAGVAVVITIWSVAGMLLDPPRLGPSPAEPWQDAWSVLGLACGVTLLMVMLLGFDSGIGASWLRPVVLVTSGLVAGGWVWISMLIPDPQARLAFVASAVVAATLPSLTQLLILAADAGEQRVEGWWLLGLMAAALVGAGVGWRLPAARVVPLGLMLYALAAAGAWVMPGRSWVMTCLAAPLVAAAAAVLVASLDCCYQSRTALRFVGLAIMAASSLGLVLALPFTWSVSGDLAQLTTSVDEVRAMARVLLGLTFSASVLASAYAWILSSRLRLPTLP